LLEYSLHSEYYTPINYTDIVKVMVKFNLQPAIKALAGEQRYSSTLLKLGTKWRHQVPVALPLGMTLYAM